MRSKTDVTNEIRQIVTDRIDRGVIVRVDWLTQEILTQKDKISGDDAEFYIACGVAFIKDTVKRCIGAYDTKPVASSDAQIVMVGFDYLQRAYTVDRDGDTVLVPVDQLTIEEIESRAQELEAMAAGCRAHAQELRDYVRARSAA